MGLGKAGIVLIAVLSIAIHGCARSKPPEHIDLGEMELPADQLIMRLYCISWVQPVIRSSETVPAGFQIKDNKLVGSDRISTVAGTVLTQEDLQKFGDWLAVNGRAEILFAPRFMAVPDETSSPVGTHNHSDISYVATWKIDKNGTTGLYHVVSPGFDVELLPTTFARSDEILIRADVRAASAKTDKFEVAKSVSKVSPALAVEEPVVKVGAVTGTVCLKSGEAAFLAHYIRLAPAKADMTGYYEHLFHIVTVNRTGKPQNAPEMSPREGVESAIQKYLRKRETPSQLPETMWNVTLRLDSMAAEPADSEAGESEEKAASTRAVSLAEARASATKISSNPASDTTWIGVSLAPLSDAGIEFATERQWVAGFLPGADEPAPTRSLDLRTGVEGVTAVAKISGPVDPQITLSGSIGGPFALLTEKAELHSIRLDATDNQKEFYSFQRPVQTRAPLEFSFALTGQDIWRLVPPWLPISGGIGGPDATRLLHLSVEKTPVAEPPKEKPADTQNQEPAPQP